MTPLTVDQQRTIHLSSLMGQFWEGRRHHVFTESNQTAEPVAEPATNDAAHGDLADGNVKQKSSNLPGA
jgi:hypothetical protein